MADGEWRAQLPADLKENEVFQPYATIGDFAKAHLDSEAKIKEYETTIKGHEGKITELEGKVKEMIPNLPADASDEEREVYWHSLGKPETAEEYEIPLMEGETDISTTKWARDTFHKANLSKEQAKFIGGEWNKLLTEIINQENAAVEVARKSAQETLLKEFGGTEQYNAATALADRLWASFTDQSFTDFLKENKMIKNPLPIIKVIIGLAKKTGEDISPSGKPGGIKSGERGMIYNQSPEPPKKV